MLRPFQPPTATGPSSYIQHGKHSSTLTDKCFKTIRLSLETPQSTKEGKNKAPKAGCQQKAATMCPGLKPVVIREGRRQQQHYSSVETILHLGFRFCRLMLFGFKTFGIRARHRSTFTWKPSHKTTGRLRGLSTHQRHLRPAPEPSRLLQLEHVYFFVELLC